MIHSNWEGLMHAKELIAHGKVSHKPFEFVDGDQQEMLGPEGTDLENHRRHHLAIDNDEPLNTTNRHRYPFGKRGEVYTRALHGIRNAAHDAGHETIRDMASVLMGEIKSRMMPEERAAFEQSPGEGRHIVKDGRKYKLYTKDGHKLISTHDTLEGAKKQEEAIKAHEADEAGRSRRSLDIEAKIIKEDGKWYVVGEHDKHLSGPHATEDEAKEALGEIVKAKNKAEDKEAKWLPTTAEMRCWMLGLELREGRAGMPGMLVGYAAVFDRFSQDLGHFRERIMPGAFAGVLDQDVRALANHDPRQLLGRRTAGTLRMWEDRLGLRTEIDLPDTQIGRDTAVSVRRGDMDGMSFAFDLVPGSDEWDYSGDTPTRTIRAIRNLYDVGPVTYPAYTDTSAAMRSMERGRTPADGRPRGRHLVSLAKARLELAEAMSGAKA